MVSMRTASEAPRDRRGPGGHADVMSRVSVSASGSRSRLASNLSRRGPRVAHAPSRSPPRSLEAEVVDECHSSASPATSVPSYAQEHKLARRNQEFYAAAAVRNVSHPPDTPLSPASTPGSVYAPPQTSGAASTLGETPLFLTRPSDGRRAPLEPIDDDEMERVERAQGDAIARRLLARDRAAAAAPGADEGSGDNSPATDGRGGHSDVGAGRSVKDPVARKVATLRAGNYLPPRKTFEADAPDGGSGDESGDMATPLGVRQRMTGNQSGAAAVPIVTPSDGVDTAQATVRSAATATGGEAGVPDYLMDHLLVPDKEVFALKARVKVLEKEKQNAEEQRDEALRVAAAADARAKAANANAANKLDKVRARAETAERAASANELRAEAAEKSASAAKKRLESMTVELQEQLTMVAMLREEIEEQRAIGLTLEDDAEALRRRVLEFSRGVPTFSRSCQTTQADLDAAAKAVWPDGLGSDLDEGGYRSKAQAWLRDLEAVGTDAHVDALGDVHRASARPGIAPRGLGRDLPPPPEPQLGAAGYSLAAAVAEVATIVEQDLIPAVDRMFQRQLPLREEIRALIEDEVMPLVEPTIAVMQQGPILFDAGPELDSKVPYRVPGQPLPLSWIMAAREEPYQDAGGTPMGITFSGPEGVVDEGWGPDVDSDDEEREREKERQRLRRSVAADAAEPGTPGASRTLGGLTAHLSKGNTGGGAGGMVGLLKQAQTGAAGGSSGDGSAPKHGAGAAKLASLFGGGAKAGSSDHAGTGKLGIMAGIMATKWAAKVKTRARAKRGTKVEASLLKAKEEGRLMEHIKELMLKAKNAPNEALRKKLRNYIADVVHTAVEDGILKKDEAANINAGRDPGNRLDAPGGRVGQGGGAGGGQEEQQFAGDDYGDDVGVNDNEGYQETEYSEGDDAYLYDRYGSEYGYSDDGDEGDGGWAGDDPSWQAKR